MTVLAVQRCFIVVLFGALLVICGCTSSVFYLQDYQGVATLPKTDPIIHDTGTVGKTRGSLKLTYLGMRKASFNCGPSVDTINYKIVKDRQNAHVSFSPITIGGNIQFDYRHFTLLTQFDAGLLDTTMSVNASLSLGYFHLIRNIAVSALASGGFASFSNRAIVLESRTTSGADVSFGFNSPLPTFSISPTTYSELSKHRSQETNMVPFYGVILTMNSMDGRAWADYYIQAQYNFCNSVFKDSSVNLSLTTVTVSAGLVKHHKKTDFLFGVYGTLISNAGSKPESMEEWPWKALLGVSVQVSTELSMRR